MVPLEYNYCKPLQFHKNMDTTTTETLTNVFTDQALANKKTLQEFEEFLGLCQNLGGDEEYQTNLKLRWKKLRGTTFMDDPVHGSRSAVIFDNRGDMDGGKSFKKTIPPSKGGGKSFKKTNLSSEGGASFWDSKPYSIQESLHDRMERVTLGQSYSEVKNTLEKTINQNDLLMKKRAELEANCAHYEREIESLKSNYQRLERENQRLKYAVGQYEHDGLKLKGENQCLKDTVVQYEHDVLKLKGENQRLTELSKNLQRDVDVLTEHVVNNTSCFN